MAEKLFAEWMDRHSLSIQKAAAALGCSKGAVQNWRKVGAPKYIHMACAAWSCGEMTLQSSEPEEKEDCLFEPFVELSFDTSGQIYLFIEHDDQEFRSLTPIASLVADYLDNYDPTEKMQAGSLEKLKTTLQSAAAIITDR